MRDNGGSTVKILRRVAEEIDNFQDNYGYLSRTEFVVDATRRLLEKSMIRQETSRDVR